MNTYTHLLIRFGLLKNCAAFAAHAARRVGRRVASRKTLLQRFLIATTASRVFQQPIRVYSRSFAVKKSESIHQ
jgi:hypothetical protein